MDKLQLAARAAHEINRAYCLSLGDTSQEPWEKAPDWQKESAIKGVQALLDDPNTTPEQMHEKWMSHKATYGWAYGPVKDAEKLTHPCMVPYSQLPENQRVKDYLFRAAVFSTLSTVAELPSTDVSIDDAATQAFKNVIMGLGILGQYPGASIAAEHDELFAGPENDAVVSESDKQLLEKMGWRPNRDGGWQKYV